MDTKRAYELITENLPSIYGYAVSHLYDRDSAEDLASEIVCEILESVGNLRDDGAFWGFAWKIAENTLRKFIRREVLKQKAEKFTDDFSNVETHVPSPEEEHIAHTEQDEQLYLIRRELSLLTKTRREVTVAYYIHNKSCSQISKELNISVEMVKYHLFKTRKQLKEGINMTRQLGKKSYDPGAFKINFWGDWNHYDSFFDRKLRGSIVLAAYYAPMTAEELSVELGVSMPYLEEEIEALEAAGVLLKDGTKYQTNLVIITEEYDKEIERKTAGLYQPVAKEILEILRPSSSAATAGYGVMIMTSQTIISVVWLCISTTTRELRGSQRRTTFRQSPVSTMSTGVSPKGLRPCGALCSAPLPTSATTPFQTLLTEESSPALMGSSRQTSPSSPKRSMTSSPKRYSLPYATRSPA